jgi:Ca-activated chloride channel homolog
MDGRNRVPASTPVLLAIVVAACGAELPRQSPPLTARLELAAGHVTIQQPGGSWIDAGAGQLLRSGGGVRVGRGDRALLRLGDGGWAFLRHGTEVRIEADGLRLLAGEAWLDVPPRERGREPAVFRSGDVQVTASDAGLDLRRAGPVAEVFVARGLAVVTAPDGRAEIKQGERARIEGARPPAVAAVPYWDDWTGGMADRRLSPGLSGTASGRIYAVDRARPSPAWGGAERRGAAPAQVLEVRAQTVRAVIRDGVARTTVDQRFFNPGSAPVEGFYWFTIPEGAAVDRFAIEVDGKLVDGEMVERGEAAAAYEAEVRMAIDPALLEWVDGRTFRCRIFPVPPTGERRVVVSYQELLPSLDGRTQYVYPLGSAGARIDELALEVDLGDAGPQLKLATTADARIERGGRIVTLRRSGYTPRGDFLLEMDGRAAPPLSVVRARGRRGEADYVMLRYAPEVDWSAGAGIAGQVVVVVDTSAGGDEAERQLRVDAAEAILRALSTGDRFALMAADLRPRMLYPAEGLAPADEANIGRALERLSAVRAAGATDLGSIFDEALRRVHGGTQPAVVYIGDGRPTVGELDGEVLAERARRALSGSAARFFAIAVGGSADHPTLERLAAIGGGASYRIDLSEQAVQEALRFVGQLKTPTVTELRIDAGSGLDQVFSTATGKLSRGQELTLLARAHHPLPAEIVVSGRLGGKPWRRTHAVRAAEPSSVAAAHVPALWARRQLGELLGTDRERNRSAILRVGLEYGLMTPFSSFLVLENEEAYLRQGIKRRPRVEQPGAVSALEVAAGVPLGLFGCSAKPAKSLSLDFFENDTRTVRYLIKPPEQRADAVPQWLARNVHRGEAGRMGSRRAAKKWASAAAREYGVLGLLSRPRTGHGSDGAVGQDAAEAMGGLLGNQIGEDGGLGGLGSVFGRGRRVPAGDDAEPRREFPDPRRVLLGGVEGCSDAASRSLAERRALWRGLLDSDARGTALAAAWTRAAARCELRSWPEQRALLELIAARISTGEQLLAMLRVVDSRTVEHLRRQLLRRALAPSLAKLAAGDEPRWELLDASLARDPVKRAEQLRPICGKLPRSSACLLRLMRALLEAGRPGDALATALRARADGLSTPELVRELGDLHASRGERDEAMRIYSELVEFAPSDAMARRLLGDIFLRHGWYQEAHRQYLTLEQLQPGDALAQLRLAAAAAGAGRVDEALRLERRLSASDGEPGLDDPRRWARLASASRLARLLASPAAGGESLRQSLERGLRRLQVVPDAGTLVILTWEDLEARLRLRLEAQSSHQRVDAVGLCAIVAPGSLAVSPRVVLEAGSARTVRYELIRIGWNGRALRVERRQGTLSRDGRSGATKVAAGPSQVAAAAKARRVVVVGEGVRRRDVEAARTVD